MAVSPAARAEARRFSLRLWITLVLLTGAATATAAWFARAQLLAAETDAARLRFATESGARRALDDLRLSQLRDLVQRLSTRPRLHAVLEDDAIDLLPEVARDELRTIPLAGSAIGPAAFHRFLDARQNLLPPPADHSAGDLPVGLETRLPHFARQPDLSSGQWISRDNPALAWELVSTAFRSTANGRLLGTLVVGFQLPPDSNRVLWSDGMLHAPHLPPPLREALQRNLVHAAPLAPTARAIELDHQPFLLATEPLHPGTALTEVWEINLASLAPLRERQRDLTQRIAFVGLAIAALAALASRWLSARFAAWFGQVLRNLEAQRLRRQLAERRLTRTTEERDRAARFAADASHQLKTPVAVLRAGLDELNATRDFPANLRPEVDELLQQTDRLGHIIDDLLLLARLDAGLVAASNHETVLDDLIDRAIDDASVTPGAETHEFTRAGVTSAVARGDPRHLILITQNLFENAVKYGLDGTPIHTAVIDRDDAWLVQVTGQSAIPIATASAEHIFERFHRGASAGGKPGYGLGLNLARQLARLHGGDLRLLKSDRAGTTFELRLRKAV